MINRFSNLILLAVLTLTFSESGWVEASSISIVIAIVLVPLAGVLSLFSKINSSDYQFKSIFRHLLFFIVILKLYQWSSEVIYFNLDVRVFERVCRLIFYFSWVFSLLYRMCSVIFPRVHTQVPLVSGLCAAAIFVGFPSYLEKVEYRHFDFSGRISVPLRHFAPETHGVGAVLEAMDESFEQTEVWRASQR